jgi:hypothetical protein
LTTAAQLHTLQMIGYNSHKTVSGIKLPFDSNEVFKVNWYNDGIYQKFDKPFALYASLVRFYQFGYLVFNFNFNSENPVQMIHDLFVLLILVLVIIQVITLVTHLLALIYTINNSIY